MKKLTSLFVTCILVLSLSGIALADGGATHGPGAPSTLPPPVPQTNSATETAEYYDVLSELTLLVTWFEQSIL
jgi:hypothetical protein